MDGKKDQAMKTQVGREKQEITEEDLMLQKKENWSDERQIRRPEIET